MKCIARLVLFLRRRRAHIHSVTVAIHADDLVWSCRDVLGGPVDLEHDDVQGVPLPHGRGGLVEEVIPEGADNRSAGEVRREGYLLLYENAQRFRPEKRFDI